MVEPTPIRKHRSKRQRVAAVMTAEIASVTAAAAEAGVSERTVRRWKNDPEMAEYVNQTRAETADQMRALSLKVLAEICERLPQYEPRDLSILLGILTDKAQLLSGEATTRTETRDLTVALGTEERDALADEVDRWLRDRTPERTDPTA